MSPANVPLLCLEACRDVVTAAEALAGRSNVNAASDVLVAALLGEAAAGGAAANVRINLPSVGDDAFAAELTERVDELLHDVHRTGGARARSRRVRRAARAARGGGRFVTWRLPRSER